MQINGTVYHRMLCDLLSAVEKHETTKAHFDPVENLMPGCKNNIIFLWRVHNHRTNYIVPGLKEMTSFKILNSSKQISLIN